MLAMWIQVARETYVRGGLLVLPALIEYTSRPAGGYRRFVIVLG